MDRIDRIDRIGRIDMNDRIDRIDRIDRWMGGSIVSIHLDIRNPPFLGLIWVCTCFFCGMV